MPLDLLPVSTPAACCTPATSSAISEQDAVQLARTLKALADPARLRLLSLIAAHDGAEACVCDLIEPVGLSQPTVSHHLKVLTDAGPDHPGQARRVGLLRARPRRARVGDPPPRYPPDRDRRVTGVHIGPLAAEHWADVERIYAAGIATGHATFEAAPPTWEAFDAGKVREHRLVALDDDGRVLGWAAASAVSDRCVYAGVIEHSVYVDPAAQRTRRRPGAARRAARLGGRRRGLDRAVRHLPGELREHRPAHRGRVPRRRHA